MSYYRNLKLPLYISDDDKIASGEVFHVSRLSPKAITILERKGNIARIATPPLEELPGWKTRAAKLAKEDIETAEQFLEAPDDDLAKLMNVKPSTIATWKQDVSGWLTAPPPKKAG